LKYNLVHEMASIAMMIGGTVINAAAFTGGNYLTRYLSGDGGQAALDEKTRHDKALEAYETAQARYRKNAQSFLTGLKPTGKTKRRRNKTSPAPITPSNSTTRRTPTGKWPCPRSQNFLAFISKARLRRRASFFLSAATR